jgi:small conductance mechanosensitive channel
MSKQVMTKQTRRLVSILVSILFLILIVCSVMIGIGAYFDLEAYLFSDTAVVTSPAVPLEEDAVAEPEPAAEDAELLYIDPFRIIYGLFALPFRIVFVILIFVAAFIIHRLAWYIAGWILNSRIWHHVFVWSSRPLEATRLGLRVPNTKMRAERQRTIQLLIASTISITAFVVAVMLALAQFMSSGALAVVTGLFTAAFGFGARTLIGDLLAGISNIFEDHFDVGEKVEIAHVPGVVEGVVESVNLRTTSVRAPTGELLVIPNGEIRVLRNFSRGRFSTADIKLKISSPDLGRALPLLEDLGVDAVSLLPNLLEPWQIISEEGTMGEHTGLTLLVKAKFGQAAKLRPNLLALVQQHLNEAGISLVD